MKASEREEGEREKEGEGEGRGGERECLTKDASFSLTEQATVLALLTARIDYCSGLSILGEDCTAQMSIVAYNL